MAGKVGFEPTIALIQSQAEHHFPLPNILVSVRGFEPPRPFGH